MILLLSEVLLVKLMVDQLAKNFHTLKGMERCSLYLEPASQQQLYELHTDSATAKILLKLYLLRSPN